MIHFLLRFLAEAPLCAFWCGVWHYLLHTSHKAEDSPSDPDYLVWAVRCHYEAAMKYGHSKDFQDCTYPACSGAKRDNGMVTQVAPSDKAAWVVSMPAISGLGVDEDKP